MSTRKPVVLFHIVLLLASVLAACAPPPPTYADLKATAVHSGCWPGNYPTPPASTITPIPELSRGGPQRTTTATVTQRVGDPTRTALPTETPQATRTALPTTTPYPRCTPLPGEPTLVPYPTRIPRPATMPTQKPIIVEGGSDVRTLLELPVLHHADIAVHPSEGWAAAASVWPEPLLLRPLTFFAAQTISKKGPEAGAAAVLQLLDQLRCDDESTGSNLASALHLLAMHRALPQQAPPQLAVFLGKGLRNGQVLRDAVVPATAAILAARVRFTDSERTQLRSALEALQDQDPEWVDRALKALR